MKTRITALLLALSLLTGLLTVTAAAEEGKAKGVKGLPMKLGMEMAAEMIAKIKDEHLCDGVHIMAIGAEKNVPTILDLAGITI